MGNGEQGTGGRRLFLAGEEGVAFGNADVGGQEAADGDPGQVEGNRQALAFSGGNAPGDISK